jgi:hypothetical protein
MKTKFVLAFFLVVVSCAAQTIHPGTVSSSTYSPFNPHFGDNFAGAMLQIQKARFERANADRQQALLESMQHQSEQANLTATAAVILATAKQPAQEQPKFQVVNTTNGVLRIEVATGKTWVLENGEWKEILSETEKLVRDREVALTKWEKETREKYPQLDTIMDAVIATATPLIEKRTESVGRLLTPSEMVELSELAYETVREQAAAKGSDSKPITSAPDQTPPSTVSAQPLPSRKAFVAPRSLN